MRSYEDETYRRPILIAALWRFRRALLVIVLLAVLVMGAGLVLPLLAGAVFWPPAWPILVLGVTYLATRRTTGVTPAQYVSDLTTTARAHRKTVLIGAGVGAGVGLAIAVVQLIDGGSVGAAVVAFIGVAAAIALSVVAYLRAAARKGAL